MDVIRRLEPLWLVLVILAGLTWAVLALFDTNIVTEVVGSGTAADVVYVLFGLGALMFVPRLVADLRPMAGGRFHMRGA
jgi:uncharacterized membrane protein YuzA (DUF378 family)